MLPCSIWAGRRPGLDASCPAPAAPAHPPQGHEDLRQDERVMQLFGLVGADVPADLRLALLPD